MEKKNLFRSLFVIMLLSAGNISNAANRTVIDYNSDVKLENKTFDDLGYRGNGGAIYNDGNLETVNGVSFYNNKANAKTSYTYEMKGDLSFDPETETVTGTYNGKSYDGYVQIEYINDTFAEIYYNGELVGTKRVNGAGGAIYSSEGSTLRNISNSTFDGNMSRMNGGAIFNSSSDDLTINNSTFTNNSLGLGIEPDEDHYTRPGGGAIFNQHNTLTVKNSTFKNNTAIVKTTEEDDNGGFIAEVLSMPDIVIREVGRYTK